jgi:hypothetical protein
MMPAARLAGLLVTTVAAIGAGPTRPSMGPHSHRQALRDTGAAVVDTPAVGSARRVEGRVVRPMARALVPVAGEEVTLHRVGADTAGPIDSTRTGRDGRYSFRYRTRGARDAVYFVSASYDGIAYLSQPLTRADVRGAEAEITVYDTTSRTLPLHVRGRHLVVSAPTAAGMRSVVEVFELSNDTSVTLVSVGTTGGTPTWSLLLPKDAQQFQVGQGDVAADAVSINGLRVQVYAPIAPGLKQMSFSYALPPTSFPLVRPLTDGAIVLEVLLEEPRARVNGVPSREQAPVAIEGRTFRRFLAQDLPPRSALRVDVPAVFTNQRQLYIAVVVTVIGAVMLGALALAFRRRPTTPSPLAGRPPVV